MRVLAGELKGQRLTTPRGSATRPTADRVRIACLDALMPYLPGGAIKDGAVEIQGDHRERIAERLRALGHTVKLAGG